MYQQFSQRLLKWKYQVTRVYNIRTYIRAMPHDTLGTLKIFGIIHCLNFVHHPMFRTKIKTYSGDRTNPHPQVKEYGQHLHSWTQQAEIF